jgi:hypothetical protein
MVTATSCAATAAELFLLGGEAGSLTPDDRTYSWQLEYRQDIRKHLAAGISYLNEGHIKQHHRDGYTAQLWTRSELFDGSLTVAAAAGPYFYLDTAPTPTPDGFTNRHGLKPMLSAALAWHINRHLVLELRSNWLGTGSDFDTVSLLAGVGCDLSTLPAPQPTTSAEEAEREPKNELTAFFGQTIVNSFNSQQSVAASLEYRRHLLRHLDWSFAGLYEGDNRLVRRDGVITELWAVQQLLRDLSVGAGTGIYIDVANYDNPLFGTGTRKPLLWIATLTSSYRFADHWAVRASWHRVITSYQRDTDVILAGIGYLF